MELNCALCANKHCKISARDCNDGKESALQEYAKPTNQEIYRNADKLVADGRAGQLSRLDEILEYIKLNNYQNIAVAYCFCMEDLAKELVEVLKQSSFKTASYRCTINGIRENEIIDDLGEGVNCNPIGQANAINISQAQFVIDMGLCLGHDVLFRTYLKKPGTTFIIKDRVHQHNPARALTTYSERIDDFLTNYLGSSMRMKSNVWLREQLAVKQNLVILDVRDQATFQNEAIPGSINIPLAELPALFKDKLPSKQRPIICVCNGSVQSAYAVSFLYAKGYQTVYNLSGGFSGWLKSKNA